MKYVIFGVPADEVKETITCYNDLVASEKDTDFGSTETLIRLEKDYVLVSVQHTMGEVGIDTNDTKTFCLSLKGGK